METAMKRTRDAVFPAVGFTAVCLILGGQPLLGAKTFNSDGDGSVSLAEFTARQGRHGEKKR